MRAASKGVVDGRVVTVVHDHEHRHAELPEADVAHTALDEDGHRRRPGRDLIEGAQHLDRVAGVGQDRSHVLTAHGEHRRPLFGHAP